MDSSSKFPSENCVHFLVSSNVVFKKFSVDESTKTPAVPAEWLSPPHPVRDRILKRPIAEKSKN
jgi:hypothetical protein